MAECTTISLIDYLAALPEATEIESTGQLLIIQGGDAYTVAPSVLADYLFKVVTIIGTNTDTYTVTGLIGVTIQDQFIDANRMLSSGIITFDDNTGQIVFDQPIPTGIEVTIHCRKNFI